MPFQPCDQQKNMNTKLYFEVSSHRDGGWCGAPFVHAYRELPVACRTVTGYRDGEWCRAAFVHSYREVPAACGTITEYRLWLCLFPYLGVKVPVNCNTLQLSGRGRRGQVRALIWSCPCPGMWLSKTGASKKRAAIPHCHGAAPASLPGALAASHQGCPDQVSLMDRRHPSWANHVTNPTAMWATTRVFPAVTWTLGLVPGAPVRPSPWLPGEKGCMVLPWL